MSVATIRKFSSRDRRFLNQTIIQGFVFMLELVTYFFIPLYFVNRWIVFFGTSFAWVAVHVADGLVLSYKQHRETKITDLSYSFVIRRFENSFFMTKFIRMELPYTYLQFIFIIDNSSLKQPVFFRIIYPDILKAT
uniref:7TM_GPCR_Srx domain-containing protein n=1 Tax=Caenorhabditis tropicalis TaxID=1561998 RepID=A0A1I7TXV2_9PELO